MNALVRTTTSLGALSLAILVATAPASAANRSIGISNESPQEIHMQVISGPLGGHNVWSGMLDRPLGAHPNTAGVDFEDHGEPFRVIFSGQGCDVVKEIAPDQVAHLITFKNCAITVR